MGLAKMKWRRPSLAPMSGIPNMTSWSRKRRIVAGWARHGAQDRGGSHVKMFHHYFFTLDPDDKVIQSNITKALYLADASAKHQYDNLKENSYYTNIISGNISQQIDTDSITVNINQYPYYFKCYAEQKIIRPTTIVTRNLITEGYLRNVSRSDNNPHGFLIEKWKTLENKDIKIENR